MTDLAKTPILSWIFQRYQTFQLDAEFTFTLVHADDAQLDLYHMVLYRNVNIGFCGYLPTPPRVMRNIKAMRASDK